MTRELAQWAKAFSAKPEFGPWVSHVVEEKYSRIFSSNFHTNDIAHLCPRACARTHTK